MRSGKKFSVAAVNAIVVVFTLNCSSKNTGINQFLLLNTFSFLFLQTFLFINSLSLSFDLFESCTALNLLLPFILLFRLVIFPMSANNPFETTDFADPRFSFWSSECALLSLSKRYYEKIIADNETNNFVFSLQRVFLFPSFDWRKIKKKIAERGNCVKFY